MGMPVLLYRSQKIIIKVKRSSNELENKLFIKKGKCSNCYLKDCCKKNKYYTVIKNLEVICSLLFYVL